MRLMIKAIKESGNNEKRFIMVAPMSVGYQASIELGFSFGIQNIILSVQIYAHYNLGLNLIKIIIHLKKVIKQYLIIPFL